MGPGFESQRDHKKRVRNRARAMISYSLFTSNSFSLPPVLLRGLFLLFFIARAMISFSLFTSNSFSLPPVLLRGLFLLFFIARAMISYSLFTSNSLSFCYLIKAQTMRSIVDVVDDIQNLF